jgi:hypothetical protein
MEVVDISAEASTAPMTTAAMSRAFEATRRMTTGITESRVFIDAPPFCHPRLIAAKEDAKLRSAGGGDVFAAAVPALRDWGEFYVIVGSAAGALTGLMFVVVALQSDTSTRRATIDLVETYSTPTVVHLASVLFVAALITTPRHSELSLALSLAASGAAGVVYSAWIFIQTRRVDAYHEFLSDWVWRHILPALGYLGCLLAGPLVYANADLALYLVAASTLVILFAGIHNAWDSAVWISSDHSGLEGASTVETSPPSAVDSPK